MSKIMITILIMVTSMIAVVFALFVLIDEVMNYTKPRNARFKLKTEMIQSEIRIEKAKGIAAAHKIISESLKNNDNYLSYLFIDSLKHTKDKVIYIPTEHGIPVIESSKK